MPSVIPAVWNDAQRRFHRIRTGLYLLRYAVIAGLLLLLASFGVFHP